MKKLSVFLKTPAGVVIAVGVIILLSELLIMLLIGSVIASFLKFTHELWDFIDPILLIAIVSPALYILILRPMRSQQVELERKLDELCSFQRLSIGRELRMKELAAENAALRNPLSVKPANNVQLTSGSLEAPHHTVEPYITTQPIEESQRNALLFMLEDLEAGRNKVEQAHKEWESALDVVEDPIFLHDKEFRILRCNKAYQRCAGIPFHELIGQPYYEVFPKNHEPLPCCLRAMEKAEDEKKEEVAVGGATYRSRAFSILDEKGAYLYSVHTLEDITERKHRETEILTVRQQMQATLEAIPDLMFDVGLDGRFYDYHSPRTDLLYALPEVFIGKTVSDILPPDAAEACMSALREANEKGQSAGKQYELQLKQNKFWFELSVSRKPNEHRQEQRFIVLARDITERKQAEGEIQHANRALATMSAVNRNLVHATNENELLQAICQAIVEQRGYRMAWVGYVQHEESKSIKIMSRAGHDEGYLDAKQLTWAETKYGMGPSGRAVRSGATQLCQDIANDPHYQPWRDAALQRGYAASISLPLLNMDHTAFGILNVYAAEANTFTPNEIDLLEEMAEDMAFGVRSLHTRHERDLALVKNQEQLVQLQDSLEDTVRAIATIGEMRDPYTSGHQVRVADLAVAIARQMGLPDEQVHGIHLAGVVHDLGKIQVPAEILSKPGKLTDIEFSLIKVHPQAGYDILKGINFTWPVAQMVLQHHERMDGSGYPQGLKGEAILLEARILSVADVVEAMSSHRPYRPGLGIETALAEITKQRGIHFDTQVVDACLALFRDQHYSFKN